MKRKNAFLLLCLLLASSLCACHKDLPADTPLDPETPTAPTAPVQPVTPTVLQEPELYEPAIMNPLTGEATGEDIGANRPYAVVFNNLEQALPQCGVGQADILYEALAEGGITRMVGIFQDISQAGALGSIRSARSYLIDFALAYDAIFVHAGGSPQAYSDIKAKKVTSIDGVNGQLGLQAYYRDRDRMASAGYEHSLFSSSALFEQYIAPLDIRHTHEESYEYRQKFAQDGTPDGESAQLFRAYFTPSKATSFEYDPQTKQYLVYEYGAPYVDGNTGQQVSVTNVLCLYTDVARIEADSAGRITTRTTGSGSGFFACSAKMTQIEWSRVDDYAQYTYTLADASPLVLGRGKTYICILPEGSAVEVVE